MIPEDTIKNTLFGGFEKNSAEACLQNRIQELNRLEAQAGVPLTKYDDSVLKKVRFGSGYDKNSVLTYLTMINQQIVMLESVLKN